MELSKLRAHYEAPFLSLLEEARRVHLEHFDRAFVEVHAALSVKTGGCPEDCKFCQQSAHYKTGVQAEGLMPVEAVVAFAKRAQIAGAEALCLGGAWRGIPGSAMERVCGLVQAVRGLGMRVCCSMGMVSLEQASRLLEAGCSEYNNNLDTSRAFYPEVITTRTYDERLASIANIKEAGLNLSCGGIIGMGESREDRIALVHEVAQVAPVHVILNSLVSCEGTPLEGRQPVEAMELARVIALVRLAMPHVRITIAGGRFHYNKTEQALLFYAGATGFYIGSKILTTPNNADHDADYQMLAEIGLERVQQ